MVVYEVFKLLSIMLLEYSGNMLLKTVDVSIEGNRRYEINYKFIYLISKSVEHFDENYQSTIYLNKTKGVDTFYFIQIKLTMTWLSLTCKSVEREMD